MQTQRPIETPAHVLGVPGRMTIWARDAQCFTHQKFVSESRPISGYGKGALMCAEIRFDDNCKNGQNSFTITASVYTNESRRRRDIAAGGCMHDEIAQVFPEFAPLIRWHLFDTRGPMHYLSNALYHASDRDYNGRAAGEACAWEMFVSFGDVPALHSIKPELLKYIQARQAFNASTLKTNPAHGEFRIVSIAHENRPGDTYKFAPKWTLAGYGEKWHECPWDSQAQAQAFADSLNTCRMHVHKVPTRYSEGKARDLRAARICAAWPDATDEQLCAPRDELRAMLEARLPALLVEFRAAIEGAGFAWEPVAAEA
jgi:hypothetical protein